MILTIDTEKLTDHSAEHLARYFDQRAAEALHLSGAVPEPHDRELDASAAKDEEIAKTIREFVRSRRQAQLDRVNAVRARLGRPALTFSFAG